MSDDPTGENLADYDMAAYLLGKREGRADALRDALAAIKQLPHDIGPCFVATPIGCTCGRGSALSAIAALMGDPTQ